MAAFDRDSSPPLGAEPGFDASFYPALERAEQHHFWFVARGELIQGLAKALVGDRSPAPRVLEVGCGTGHVVRAVEAFLPDALVVGVDALSEGLAIARICSPSQLIQAAAGRLPFDAAFDLVLLLDVLEHVTDDRAVLSEVRAAMRPGGRALVTAPAYRGLWSDFDVVAEHRRRYRRQDLERSMVSSGFRLLRSSYFMASLLGPAWMHRRLAPSGRRGRERVLRELRPSPLVNRVALWLLRRENTRLLRGASFPFGLSVLAIGERTPD